MGRWNCVRHTTRRTFLIRAVSGRLRRRVMIGLLVFLGLGGAIAGAGMMTGFLPNPVVAGDPKASGLIEPRDQPHLTVKVVRPKREANFRITTQLPVAKVEPFYQAGLRPRVSGEVLSVSKDIGEAVKAGELLIEIDAPDLKQAVEQKQAIILQREKELSAAVADKLVAQKAVDAAKVGVRVKGLEVKRARDLIAARKLDLDAVTTLHKQGAVLKDKVDAAQLDFNAATLAVEAAEVDVEKARVEEAGKAASLEKAITDVELKAGAGGGGPQGPRRGGDPIRVQPALRAVRRCDCWAIHRPGEVRVWGQ